MKHVALCVVATATVILAQGCGSTSVPDLRRAFNRGICAGIELAQRSGQLRDLANRPRGPLTQEEVEYCSQQRQVEAAQGNECHQKDGKGIDISTGKAPECTCTNEPGCQRLAAACEGGMSLPDGGGVGWNCDSHKALKVN